MRRSDLPPSEAALADLLLAHPGRLATHSATELAAQAGVSKAAVTRLVHRLGYPDHASARKLARDAVEWGSPLFIEGLGSTLRGPVAALDTHIEVDRALLEQVGTALAKIDLAGIVEALAASRRVVLIGLRNSAWIASYARAQFSLLRGGVELAPLPAETLAEGLAGAARGDLVFFIGFRRRPRGFSGALRAARGAHARIVLLADPSAVALGDQADWFLCCPSSGASSFDSYVGAVSLVNFLSQQLALRLGREGQQRMREVEAMHRILGDLA